MIIDKCREFSNSCKKKFILTDLPWKTFVHLLLTDPTMTVAIFKMSLK